MAQLNIILNPSGGFKAIYNNQVFSFSNAEYNIQNGIVEIVTTGMLAQLPILAVSEIKVNQVTYTTGDALAAALDAIGFGVSKGFFKPALPATGLITISGDPADEDTVTIDDGVVEAGEIFEFSGAKSAGALSFILVATPTNPADGDILTLDPAGDDETIFEFNTGSKFKTTITFADDEDAEQNPVDGNKLIFDDTTFIFLDTPEAATDFTEVEIGADADATMANFITAFNTAVADFTAAAADPADHTCTIEADAVGTAGNILIAIKSNYIQQAVTEVGRAAGDNLADPDYIGVAIGADADATMVSFIAKWNANINKWKATAATPADHTCTLKAIEIGTAGDVTITTDSANVDITSPTGGADAGDNLTVGQIEVAVGVDANETAANLAAAINTHQEDEDFKIAAVQVANTLQLTNLVVGVDGNATITKSSDALTVSGMAGGKAKVDLEDLITAVTP